MLEHVVRHFIEAPSGRSDEAHHSDALRHPVDRNVAELAERQHGVVTTQQLVACGVSRGAIARRVKNGRLHNVHRGVYVVGHMALAPLAKERAALLACGRGAVLSHWSAAALWGFGEADDRVHVTVPGRQVRPRPGIEVHRTTTDARDVRTRSSLPLTAPDRTVLDLRGRMSATAFERLVAEGIAMRLVSRGLLGEDAQVTRSEAERALLRLVKKAGIEHPQTNQRVAGHEVDAVWRDHGVIAEVDGFAFHGHRLAFERDRRKDRALLREGWTVLRITWRQLRDEPEAVVADLAGTLSAAGPRTAPTRAGTGSR